MELLTDIGAVFADFANPKKRVFVGYLFLSILIALIWLVVLRKSSIRSALAQVFDRSIFFSGSSLADYKIFVINRLFTFFISPLLLTQVAIATGVYMLLLRWDVIPWGALEGAPHSVIVIAFSMAMFVVDDFTKYLMHRWMHRWPMLWSIHKVHHSATTLTPVTVYRVHPFEGVLYASRSAIAQGSVISTFYFMFGDRVDLVTIVGVNILVFFFHVTGSNLRHSHISIRYWPWLERVLISPAQHQLHHSIAKRHFDKNFGVALAIWDWAFGSLHLSEDGENEKLTFGLDDHEGSSDTDLKTLYLGPVYEIARRTAGIVWPWRGRPAGPSEKPADP
ncbi:sterol desaturase family protein [Tateyamaria sp.]|uniref:sterol desaturase family protein n=1 Tax=Tateyamaria sp. TaxID=1929288 RepID=UPI00329DE2A5